MLQFNHVLVIDLTSYGSAFSIINQFCDDEQVKVFEISPVGTQALLILTIQDSVSAELIFREISSFYNSNVLSIRLIKNINDIVLKTYLSQAQERLKEFVLIQEFSFLSEAFETAQNLIQNQISLVDFRVIRTCPMNVILTSTASSDTELLQIKENSRAHSAQFISQPTRVMKDFFSIIKN